MAVNRNTDPYGGRFARDASGSSVEAGYRQAVAKQDTAMIRRNLEPYKKYGLEQRISVIRGETDQQRYEDAAKAVVAKFKAERGKTSSGGGNSGGGTKTTVKPRTTVKPKPKPKPKPKHKVPTVKKVIKKLGQGKPPKVVMPKPKPKPIKKLIKKLGGGKPPRVVIRPQTSRPNILS